MMAWEGSSVTSCSLRNTSLAPFCTQDNGQIENFCNFFQITFRLPLDSVGVKARDAQTIVVELLYPSPYFLELTAQSRWHPCMNDTKDIHAFNGPFLVDECKNGSCMRLKANPYYWDKGSIRY